MTNVDSAEHIWIILESYDLALSAFACSCPKDAAKYNVMRTLN